nr:reverse transcriptase domain-containing protein [Tanacetum cinerariifolium]
MSSRGHQGRGRKNEACSKDWKVEGRVCPHAQIAIAGTLIQDKGKIKAPPPMTTPVEKRNHAKFCEFHGEVGHNTDECMNLRKQIEEMLKAGMLSHLVKEIKQNNGKEQPKPADMTGVPRHITKHRLNVREGCSLIRQKKRGQPADRNPPIQEEVGKLVEAGIMREVHYHDLLSNPVMVKNMMEAGGYEIIRDIEETFKTLREINMKLNLKKCPFGVEEGMFLGYKVNAKGLKVCPDKKKCMKKSDFHWTTKAEEAFKKMKLIAEIHMLKAPMEKEELIVYLAAANETVSAVLMTEREAKQIPIYFVSRALRGPELNYTSMEKLVLTLVHASKRLKRTDSSVASDKVFGGKVVLFGGDFRQILPVITNGGNGKVGGANDGESTIVFLDNMLIPETDDDVGAIIDDTYLNLLQNLWNPSFFQEKAILAPTHEMVDIINERMLSLLLDDENGYESSDSVCLADKDLNFDDSIYTKEFLNGLRMSHIPNHSIK